MRTLVCIVYLLKPFFCFFKLKTAYEMRISDWSSDVCSSDLVVRDGEAASKFIEIQVSGAVSDDSAKRVALAIANSPLVKTAIAGEDANWGRVVMAVGKAGEPADRKSTRLNSSH